MRSVPGEFIEFVHEERRAASPANGSVDNITPQKWQWEHLEYGVLEFISS